MTPTSSTLHSAMELHKKGEIDEAAKCYRQLIDNNSRDKRVYVNYAAILRKQGKANEAGQIITKGLKCADDKSPMLHNTLGNCLRDLERYPEAINCYRKALEAQPGYYDAQISIIGALYEGGYKVLSDRCLWQMYKFYGHTKRGILNQIITREVEKSNNENRPINSGLVKLLQTVDVLGDEDEGTLPLHWYLTAQLCCDSGKIKEAKEFYEMAVEKTGDAMKKASDEKTKEKTRSLYTISSWNFSCQLLRSGEMKLGWKLYDHGLNAPCDGPQKWQRALFKPFTYSKVKPWKGEGLLDKRILLLGEQGIGDTMAFISLITKIEEKTKEMTLVVPQRLEKIYERSLPMCTVLSDKYVRDNPLNEKDYDYQCPLGSMIQYLYTNVGDFKNRYFKLEANKDMTKKLKGKYLDIFKKDKPIIGISWQGGGKQDRITDKSIDLNELIRYLRPYDLNLLSLQYGDDEKIVKKTAKEHNVNFIDDPDIQATKDMENWLNQVDACDAVISIANTTIHGAGGLRKPTICLLGEKADWRWLRDKEEKTSYWYPTVQISWQDKSQGGWNAALQNIPQWLRENQLV